MKRAVYSYSLVRFVPDIARGEAANLGIIVVDDDSGEAASAFCTDMGRKIAALAPDFPVEPIINVVHSLRTDVDDRSQGALRGVIDGRIRSSAQLRTLAAAMRNQIQLSEPRPFAASSLSRATSELYAELVHPVGASRASRLPS